MASSATYGLIRKAATSTGAWPAEQDNVREVLADRDIGGLVDVLLADGDIEAAWDAAAGTDTIVIGDDRWARLAEAREPNEPAAALGVYLRLIDSTLQTADRRAYRSAAKQLKRAQRSAVAAGLSEEFDEHLAALREQHRRRPTLIAILDKAGLV